MFRILDAIDQEVGGAADPAIIDEFLFDLSSIAVLHFANEESHFPDLAYPDAEAHVADHRKFLATLTDLTKALGRGESAVDHAAIKGLRAALNWHLQVFDAPYSRLLVQKFGPGT
ncbi:MAG: hemerythrin family protein [Candidatus Sericytochromatia bacterium]|nr:hemerythrin family protein [Candidatus Tanganyikabacteria bacterium]